MKKLILLSILFIVGCNETTEPQDCAGVTGGTAELDNCNVCDSDSSNDNTTCTQDCAGEWGGDAISRLMGDIDGDGYITGGCCEQASCQNNPEYENVISPLPCDGPAGDGLMIALVQIVGCGEWTPEHVDDLPTADNCPEFYWIDIDGNWEIGSFWDISCPGGYYTGNAEPNMIEGQCCVPDSSDSPCAGKCIGEECCISE